MQPTILWFRRDLRLTDNPALADALQRGRPVIPVYVHSPGDEDEWAPGGAQCWWLHQSLLQLQGSLAEKGSRLIIREGPAAAVIPALAAEVDAGAVLWNRLYEPALIQRDSALKTALAAEGIETVSFNAALLAEPWALETGAGGPYRVFTPYWRTFGKTIRPAPPLPAPATMPPPERWPSGLGVGDLGLMPTRNWIEGLADCWTPGEAGAVEQLVTFTDGPVARYGSDRDVPAEPGTSRLSPHLHFGEISPRQAWHATALRQDEPGLRDQVEHFHRELGWREFAHHVLFHYPDTPSEPMDARFARFPWRRDSEELLRAWRRGRTGFPIVDAGMRQLWQTGWMHNRVRMIVASLLVKNLRIPWQTGAAWFWDTLVDADLASNTMGWQWAAGCGADAAPYFRIFNPLRQSERFDPDGRYVKTWVPELASLEGKALHAPWLSGDNERCGYPAPVVDLKTSRQEALDAFAAIKSGS